MSKSENRAYFRHVLLISFLCAFFQHFTNGFEISVKFCVFYTHIELLRKKIVLLFLALFVNFDCKCARNGSKNGKSFF